MSAWGKMVDADKQVTAALDRLTDIRCQLIPEYAADELETMAKGLEAIANLLEANRQAARGCDGET